MRKLIKRAISNICVKYTLIFLGCMLAIFLYMIFAGMAKAPTFTYAEF